MCPGSPESELQTVAMADPAYPVPKEDRVLAFELKVIQEHENAAAPGAPEQEPSVLAIMIVRD